MSDTTAQHGAVFVKSLAEDLLGQGLDVDKVFDGTGIDPRILQEEKPVADFASIASFFEKWADQTGNDMLGFQRGQANEMRRSGLICYVGMSSPTTLDFYKNVARYRRVFSDVMEIDTGRLEAEGVLSWYFNVPSTVVRRQYVEFGATGMMASLRKNVDHRIVPDYVTFKHYRKTNRAEFEDFFGCDVRFGARANELGLKASDLERPLATADNELYSVLTQYCEEVLQRQSSRAPGLIVDVERAIVDRLAVGEASQNKVAIAMGMSARTLSRRLAGEGTTFFRTLEELRKSLAMSYLRDSDLVLAEISFLLGYSGLSSFSEAFKRWTGQSPGQYRYA